MGVFQHPSSWAKELPVCIHCGGLGIHWSRANRMWLCTGRTS